MAEKKDLTGPDLARGISLSKLADGSMLQGHAKGEPILVARRGDGYFAIGAILHTMALRWPQASSSTTPSVAPGTTPVSVFARERRCARRRLTRWPAGRLRRATASSLCATRCPQRNRGGPALRKCRRTSSSWAAVRQGTPQPKCCGVKDIAAT